MGGGIGGLIVPGTNVGEGVHLRFTAKSAPKIRGSPVTRGALWPGVRDTSCHAIELRRQCTEAGAGNDGDRVRLD